MIRRGTPDDYVALGRLQTASWQTAYRGMLPDDYLENGLAADLDRRWSRLRESPADVLLVAESAGQIVGFIYVLGQTPPYVDNLHVDPLRKRQGIGEQLMRAAARELMSSGRNSMWLTVITTNLPALRFYEGLGAERGPTKSEMLFGNPVESYPMIWSDLTALADEPRHRG